MNLPSSSTNQPRPAPPTIATKVRTPGAMNDKAAPIATTIIRPPQIACEMCSVPLPTWGYPVRTRKNRLPRTPATAHARKMSRLRDSPVDRTVNERIFPRDATAWWVPSVRGVMVDPRLNRALTRSVLPLLPSIGEAAVVSARRVRNDPSRHPDTVVDAPNGETRL